MSEPVPELVPSARLPLRKPGKRTLAILWVSILIFAVLPGSVVIGLAVSSGLAIGARIFLLVAACVFLFLPARIVFVFLRRRVRTGSWKMADEERLANRAKWVGPKAEKSIKRIDLLLVIVSPALAAIFTFNAVLYGRDLARSYFHGAGAWFYALVWVLLAVQELWSLFRKYSKKLDEPSGKEPNPGNA